MKRLQLITSLLLFIQLFSYGQTNRTVERLSISLGPALPIGQFAKKNIYSEKAGFASIGGVLDVSYLMPYKKKVGILFSLRGQVNPIDRHAMAESFSNLQFPNSGFWAGPGIPPNPPPQPTITYPNWKFKWSSWSLGSLMAGGYTEFKTNSAKLSLTSKAMIGLVYAVSPRTAGSSVTDTSIVQVKQSVESGFGFSYSLGSNLKFKVHQKLDIIAGADFFATNRITFKNIITITTTYKYMNDPARRTVSQFTRVTNGKQSIGSLNLSAGLSFKL